MIKSNMSQISLSVNACTSKDKSLEMRKDDMVDTRWIGCDTADISFIFRESHQYAILAAINSIDSVLVVPVTNMISKRFTIDSFISISLRDWGAIAREKIAIAFDDWRNLRLCSVGRSKFPHAVFAWMKMMRTRLSWSKCYRRIVPIGDTHDIGGDCRRSDHVKAFQICCGSCCIVGCWRIKILFEEWAIKHHNTLIK